MKAVLTARSLSKATGLALALFALAACKPTQPVENTQPPMTGADRDAHGCIASAGYSWCAQENSCVRPWELATSRNLANTTEAITAYCAGKGS